MIKSLTKITIIWLAFLFSSQALARNEVELNQLKTYLSEKKFAQAYEYSESLAGELAGDLTFDFLAGLAAFGAEKYQAAVFAFERVVILEPTSFNGRYYLGLSYKKVDNLHGAIIEFETLLANSSIGISLSEEQKSKVSTQLYLVNTLLIDRQRSWSHEIALGIGSDNNINSGSSEDEITLPDGTLIPLFDTSKATADGTYSARYHLNYQHPLSQYQRLLVDLLVQSKSYFSHNEYNRQLLSFSIKYEHQLSDDATWYLGATTAPLWFSSEKYRTQNAINFGWQQPINTFSNYGFNGMIADINQFVYDDLDFERYQMNAFYRIQSTYQHLFLLNWYQDENKKGLDYNNRMSIGISYVLSYPLYDYLSGNTMLMYEKQIYDEPNPLFGVYSDSALSLISTELIYSGFVNQVLQLQISYQDKRVDSQLSAMQIYEYDRFEANFTWKYAF